jgi:DNA polymerase III epsilon subunit-like protein
MPFQEDRIKAIQFAKEKVLKKPLYLDTETTGIGDWDEIVEISILDYDGSVLFDSLVRPTRRIPADAIAIHGIKDDMVQDSPQWSDVWSKVEAILQNREIAIYNADFDIRMMRQSHRLQGRKTVRLDHDFFCIMKLYAQFYGAWNPSRRSYRWQSLENAGQQCGIPLLNTHRAKDDAALARAVLLHIAGSE